MKYPTRHSLLESPKHPVLRSLLQKHLHSPLVGEDKMSYTELLTVLHYPQFKNPSLLTEAFTHRTFVEEHPWASPDQERLEWLGDAFLQYKISAWLFDRYRSENEGQLTSIRKLFTEGSWHSQVAESLELHRFVRLGRGELTNTNNKRLGRDTLEALIGAILLDGGETAAWAAVQVLLTRCPPKLDGHYTTQTVDTRDPIVALGEWWQKTYRESMPKPEYHRVGGPDHAPIFECRITLPDYNLEAEGRSTNKQEARRLACQHALELLNL